MATACDLPLVKVDNINCDVPLLGKQPVQLLYQDPAGEAPDLITVPGTGADPRLADLQAAMTVPANGANAADQVFTLSNIAGGTLGAAADEVISGNDVPYGGTIVTGRERTIAGRIDYLTPANNTAMNSIMRRGGKVRFWLVDENEFVQGPFENGRLIFGNIQRPGIGTATTHRAVTITHRGIEEPQFASKPLVGVSAVTNA